MSAAAPASTRRTRAVLASVVALQLVAETALTPYWPQLLRQLFGIEDLSATGSFLTVCRMVGLVALPLWGLAALRWSVRSLLVAGLLGCVVCDLALALAPTFWALTAFSAGVVASGSVLVLAYPALVAVVERDGRAERHTAVVTFWAVFHGAAVLSTVVGAAIVALPQPRWGLAAFAVVDLALALLVLAVVPSVPPVRRGPRPAVAPLARARRALRPRNLLVLRPWIALVVVVVLVDTAVAVPRPFLVELLVADGIGPVVGGLLFLVPAVASLAVLPLAAPLLLRLRRGGSAAAALVAAGGLLVQSLAAAAGDTGWFLLGRILLGAGIGVLLVALDLVVFDRVGTTGAAFSAVETSRSGALLAAPIVATVAAGAWLGAPLVVGAVLLLAAAAVLPRVTTRPSVVPDQEHQRVLDPVH